MTKLIVPEKNDVIKTLIDCFEAEWNSSRYEADGIHLSDLMGCPKQSYFKIKLGVHHNLKTFAYFFDGKGIHMALQELFNKYHPGRFLIENKRRINDLLTFTPDVIDTKTNTIIEIKTARSPVINVAPRQDHVEQLKSYMAFSKIYDGVVFYHLITKTQENLFTQWPIHIDEDEAEQIRQHWLDEAQNLDFALRYNDKTLARHIADDPNKNWRCNGYCDYIEYCEEGQAAVESIIAKRAEAKELRELARVARTRKTNATT